MWQHIRPMSKLESPTSQRTVVDLLRRIISASSDAQRVSELPLGYLVDAHRGELELSEGDYDRLMAAIELGRRIDESIRDESKPKKIAGSRDAIEFCQREFDRIITYAKQEIFCVVTLSTKNEHIGTHEITTGTLDCSLVHPREVFRPAIRDAASSILLAHNHPSGDPTPSREDLTVTDRLEECGKLVGIDVLDHIVVARRGCVSIRTHRA